MITLCPTRIKLCPHGLLYIERRFCNLNHPRIVHLCNLLEVSPSKWLISKALISIFFYFWSWFHKIWYQSFGFQGFTSPNRSSWNFRYNVFPTKVQKLKFLGCEADILRNIITKFQSFIHNIFGYMICGSQVFFRLLNFISKR